VRVSAEINLYAADEINPEVSDYAEYFQPISDRMRRHNSDALLGANDNDDHDKLLLLVWATTFLC